MTTRISLDQLETRPKANKNQEILYNIIEKKLRSDELAEFLDRMYIRFKRNSNSALKLCCVRFGRERFSNSMRMYIHRHTLKVSMQLAATRCFNLEVGDGRMADVSTKSS